MTRTIALLLLLAGALAPHAASAAGQPEKRTEPVAVGQIAPEFTLEDQEGRKLALSAERGRPVVLVFYRGHW